MKKIVLFVLIAALSAFSMELTKNELNAKVEYELSTTDKLSNHDYTTPGVDHELKMKNNAFQLKLESVVRFDLGMSSYDGEMADNSSKNFLLGVRPEAKYNFNEMFSAQVALPFIYSSFTPAMEDADAVPVTQLDVNAGITYGKP